MKIPEEGNAWATRVEAIVEAGEIGAITRAGAGRRACVDACPMAAIID